MIVYHIFKITPSRPPKLSSLDPIKIIAQEADPDIRNVLQIVLEDFHYQVFTLFDCEKLLDTIQIFNPQVVLLDFKLTGRESIAACKKIKVLYPDLPVIALSCNSNIHKLYLSNGFDDYIRKPFDIDHLYQILKRHIPEN